MSTGTVTTRYGIVRGEELTGKYEGITIFKGIPYAAPPLGPLRWRPPQDPKKWEGVQDFTKYAPAAIQEYVDPDIAGSVLTAQEFYSTGYPEMSEDCLYLNVCTGAVPGDKSPVYIWFHGGGFTNGFSYEDQFDPRELAKKGVTVVSVGHRMGIFGFLALPQLTKEQGFSGNYGLMDLFKALDWVYENIAAFGGDPENITVGGQSSGCHKAFLLASSAKTKGRIRRVIGQSGLTWLKNFLTLRQMEEKSENYLKRIGVDPTLPVDALRNMDVSELYVHTPRGVMPADICVDGEYIVAPDLRYAFDLNLAGVDILCGSNCGEAAVFESTGWKDSGQLLDTAEKFYAYYRELLGELYDKYDFSSLVSVTDDTAWETARTLASLGLAGNFSSNISRNLMINRIFGMRHARKNGRKTYAFLFTHREPINPEDKGSPIDPDKLMSWHSSELWFVFNSLKPGIPPCRPWRDLDFRVAEMMNTYWANFIKTGDPNGEGLPHWPAAGDDYGYIELCGNPVSGRGAEAGLDGLIREFVLKEYDISVE